MVSKDSQKERSPKKLDTPMLRASKMTKHLKSTAQRVPTLQIADPCVHVVFFFGFSLTGTVDMDMSLVCFAFVLRMDLKEASASL